MALNYVPLSKCVSLFVASQFRVCVRQTANPVHRCYSKYVLPWVPARTLQCRSRGNKRILYQQTSLCCWRDIQNFSSTPTMYNPHASFVRAKYFGDKAGSGSELLPFMSKTGKNKKLVRAKNCLECGKKVPSKDKLKIFRRTVVPSPAATLNADLKSQALLKPSNGKKSDRAQKQIEDVSASQVATEMVNYFNKFIDQLNKMDRTLRLQKIKDSSRINRYGDSSIPLILPVREATNPQTSSSVSAEAKAKGYTTASKNTAAENKTKINSKLNQVERDSCSVKEAELLEIRPKFVENIQHKKDGMNFKKTRTTSTAKSAAKKEMSTYVDNNGFILVESASYKHIENKVPAKNQESVPYNEKGFILVYPEESKGDQSSTYRASPEEKGFILVNDKGQTRKSQRRSKEDNRNFVLVNDNPFYTLKSTRTSVDDGKTSQVSNVKDVLPRPAINVQIHMIGKETLGRTSLDTQYGKNTENRMSSLFENQNIGSSDSKEELKRQRKTSGDVKTNVSVSSQHSKPDRVLNFQPVNSELANGIVGGQLEDAGLQISTFDEQKIFQSKMATCKNADDSANRNIIQVDNSTINGSVKTKEGGIQNEGNATKRDDITAKKGDSKKANAQFQRGAVGSKSAQALHVDDFGNAMKEYSKVNVEKNVPEKKRPGKKRVKQARSFVNVATKESTKSSAKETSPQSVEVGKTTKTESLKKPQISTPATNLNMADFNSYDFRPQRSPAVAVHELKPDSPQKKVCRRSPKVNTAVAKPRNEPQLIVTPEEMCNKKKLGSRPQHMFPQTTSSTYSSVDKSPTEKGLTSSPRPLLDAKQELEQLNKINSQEMNKCQNNIFSVPEKKQVAPMKSFSDTNGFSSARSETTSAPVKTSMTLSDVFQQLQHTKDTKTPRSSSTTSHNSNAPAAQTRSSRKDDELLRIIRQQWSQDFQKKFYNLQPITVYNPDSGNCSTEATQNSNTSAGSMLKKDKKTSRHAEKKSKHQPPPAPNMVHVSRKSDHLPTMGMAERLLAASQRPSATPGTSDLSPKVKDSESSINTYTDATVTQGTAEVEEFPEVDQFEEFVQKKMPEIFSDNKAKTTLTGDAEVGLPINKSTNDILKLSNVEPFNELYDYEGSNVDGDVYSLTATQQPRSNNNAEPTIENELLYNSIIANTIPNDRHPDKNTSERSRGTSPKAQYSDKSASTRNTSMTGAQPANVASSSHDPYRSHDDLTNTNKSTRQVGSAINICHKDTSLPTSTPTSTRRSAKGVSLSKSTMLKPLDGFACLTLVEAPQKTSPKNLKPTLKRSPSRERGEEKRVTFVKTSKDDNIKVKYSKMGSSHTQINRYAYAGSSVDRPEADDDFSGGNNSKECDIRTELAEQRKRAEMEARIKLLNEHSRQIREYEAVLSKYRDIVGKFRDDALKAIRGQDSEKQRSSEV